MLKFERMHIEHAHNLGKEEAIGRINTSIEALMRRELPAGVKVTDVIKNWTGDTLRFSFAVKKGFFGAKITGSVQVADDKLVMDVDLPGILMAFVSEAKIREDMQKELTKVFSAA